MITNASLRFYRKHETLDVPFSTGLNVLRGANEAGKSSFLEGLMYPVYGTDIMSETFSDTVTWGHPDKDLSVTVTHKVGNTLYNFKRSKSSASLTWTDPDTGEEMKITGQSEVTKKAEEILTDYKTAKVLMFATQADLRGVLNGRPSAINDLISMLAGVDLLDAVIDAGTKNLTTGTDKTIKDRLATLADNIQTASDGIPSEADIQAPLTEASRVQVEIEANEQHRQVLNDRVSALKTSLDNLVAGQQRHQQAKQALERATGTHARAVASLATIQARIQPVDEAQIDVLSRRVTEVETVEQRRQLWSRVSTFPKLPEVVWTDDAGTGKAAAQFKDALATARLYAADLQRLVTEAQAAVRVARGHMITDGKCPTCGHAARSAEEVAEHNKKAQAEVDAALAALATAQQNHKGAMESLDPLEAVEAGAARFCSLVSSLEGRDDCIVADYNTYPPSIRWVGEEPTVTETTAQLNAKIQAIRKVVQENARAAGEIEGQKASAELALEAIETAKQALEDHPEVSDASVRAEYNEALGAAAACLRTSTELTQKKLDFSRSASTLAERRDQRLAQVQKLREEVVKVNAELVELEYNNTFMKDLRLLKPVIGVHLWNLLLTSVTVYFSQMRKTQSIVTREDTGFKVNGKPASGLSGSTQDLLALAIRVALIKTFTPEIDFIVLDEPAHGCDVDRTKEMLAFLASMGFNQVILASHDEVSESVANRLIAM